MSEIDESLAQGDRNIESLTRHLDTLEERLGPVLKPLHPKASSEVDHGLISTPDYSPIGRKVENQNTLISDLTERVSALISRLAI